MYGIPKDTTAGSQGYGEHGEGNGGKEPEEEKENIEMKGVEHQCCLLYTSDAADE